MLQSFCPLTGAAIAPTPAAPTKAAGEASGDAAGVTPGEDQAMGDLEEVDDPELALALQMSLADAQGEEGEEKKQE